MCVYCKQVPACDHERDACAASRGRAMHRVWAQLRGDPVAHCRTEMGVRMVPNGKSSHAKAAEEGTSSAMGERAGQKQ
jgi:hypothetical protein